MSDLEILELEKDIDKLTIYTDVNCIIQPHFDINGRLDGGWIVNNGILKGHADPSGEPGKLGINGIN